jgi:hypothetical protein
VKRRVIEKSYKDVIGSLYDAPDPRAAVGTG